MDNWIDAIIGKLRDWWDSFIHKLPDLLLVILIMIAAIIIGKQLRRWSYRLLFNYSLTKERRIELEFFIDSATDLSKAHKAITDAMIKITYLFPGKPVEIYYNDFRENAVKLSVWFWIDNHAPPGYMVARHDAIFYILESLKEQSITLVVPMSLQSIKMS